MNTKDIIRELHSFEQQEEQQATSTLKARQYAIIQNATKYIYNFRKDIAEISDVTILNDTLNAVIRLKAKHTQDSWKQIFVLLLEFKRQNTLDTLCSKVRVKVFFSCNTQIEISA